MVNRFFLYRNPFSILWALVLLWFEPAMGYRPFSTEDAYPTGKGIWNLEVSYDWMSFSRQEEHHFLQLVPVFGATPSLDLSFTFPYLFVLRPEHSVHGHGDVVFSGKWVALSPSRSSPGLAVRGSIKLHTGNFEKGLGTGDLDLEALLASSYPLGAFFFHAMAGYWKVGRRRDPDLRSFFFAGLAVDAPLYASLRLAGEASFSQPQTFSHQTASWQFMLGGYWSLSSKVLLDGGWRWGDRRVFPAQNWFIGITFAF